MTLWLSVIVLLPLAAVVEQSLQDGLGDVLGGDHRAAGGRRAAPHAASRSLIIVAINVVMGTLIAWVLVRDEFRGKRLVNSLIDLPFALPTIVAGLTLLALYGRRPDRLDVAYTKAAVVLALLFVTLPFVVRAVQPVLLELDREMEEAAALARRVAVTDLPPDRAARTCAPAIVVGRGARVRARDRRVRLAGPDLGQHPVRHPGRRRSTSSGSIETDNVDRGGGRVRGAAVSLSVVLLVGAAPRLESGAVGMHVDSRGSTLRLRFARAGLPRRAARRAGRDGLLPDLRARASAPPIDSDHHARTAIHAFWLTLIMVAIAVPLNTVFGVARRARAGAPAASAGKAILDALIDLPFAISPVVVGLALLLVYGRDGLVRRRARRRRHPDHLLDFPGIVLATIFVSLPFVVREVVPGAARDRRRAGAGGRDARRLGWQTFWRVTLPAIRWGVAYGVVLTTARALGEFGAVSVVSGKISGETETLHAVRREALPELRPGGRLRGVDRCSPLLALVDAVLHDPAQAEGEDSRMGISVEHVEKHFGDFAALDDVSLDGARTAR